VKNYVSNSRIISDRILHGKSRKNMPGSRTLRVGLTQDKENTLVSLKKEVEELALR